MKAAEILRKLADMIDQHSDAQSARPANSVQHAELAPVEITIPNKTDPLVQCAPLPPLQAKLELLKKATGVASYYDDECEEPDELTRIKQNAGISPVVVHVAADDDILG
jgi:hypothetical protein